MSVICPRIVLLRLVIVQPNRLNGKRIGNWAHRNCEVKKNAHTHRKWIPPFNRQGLKIAKHREIVELLVYFSHSFPSPFSCIDRTVEFLISPMSHWLYCVSLWQWQGNVPIKGVFFISPKKEKIPTTLKLIQRIPCGNPFSLAFRENCPSQQNAHYSKKQHTHKKTPTNPSDSIITHWPLSVGSFVPASEF